MGTLTARQEARQNVRDQGGRYAETVHDEADVDLSDAIHNGYNGDAVDLEDLSTQEMFDVIDKMAKGAHERRLSQATDFVSTHEDLRQEIALQVLEAKARNDHAFDEVKNNEAYLRRVTMSRSLRMSRSDFDAKTITALNRREAALREFEQGAGRPASVAEAEEITDEVRMSFPPDQRPSADYARRQRFHDVSLSDPLGDGSSGTELGDLLADEDSWTPERMWEAKRSMLNADAEDVDSFARACSAKLDENTKLQPGAYNSLAEATGGPEAVEGAITRGRKQRHLIPAMQDLGGGDTETGVVRAIELWNNGESPQSHPAVAALFAPFGDVAVENEIDVIETLERGGKGRMAAKLWQSALASAESRSTADTERFKTYSWAKSQGMDVPARGALSADVLTAYEASLAS